MKKGEIFQYKDSKWYYCRKTVDVTTFTIRWSNSYGFDSKEAAENAYNQDIQSYKRDLDHLKRMTNMKFTFVEYMEFWAQKVLPTITTSVSATSLWAIYDVILPQVDRDYMLGYVTIEFLTDLLKKCVGYSASSGEVAQKLLRKVMKSAYVYGLVKTDFTADITCKSVRPYKAKIVCFSQDQIRRFLQAASRDQAAYLEVLLALFCGLRNAEIRGLRFSDFNRQEHTVRIERQITRSYNVSDDGDHYDIRSGMVEKEPKTNNAYRTLRIPDFVFDELENRRRYIDGLVENGRDPRMKDYVSLSPKTLQPKSTNMLPNHVCKICAAAGVPRLNMHALRHLFATILIENGVDLPTVSHLLGHSRFNTTFDLYVGICEANEITRGYLEDLDCPANFKTLLDEYGVL